MIHARPPMACRRIPDDLLMSAGKCRATARVVPTPAIEVIRARHRMACRRIPRDPLKSAGKQHASACFPYQPPNQFGGKLAKQRSKPRPVGMPNSNVIEMAPQNLGCAQFRGRLRWLCEMSMLFGFQSFTCHRVDKKYRYCDRLIDVNMEGFNIDSLY